MRKRLSKGETEAFVELYDMLGDRLNRYLALRLNPTDCHDVLQEIFVRLVRYHKRLGKAENLTAYVFLTARNESIRWIKKHKSNRISSSTSSISDPKFDVVDPDSMATEQHENRELADRLLSELSEESCEIVSLKIYSQLTFAEIAKMLGLPNATVATKYRRAITKLKERCEVNNESQTRPKPEDSNTS